MAEYLIQSETLESIASAIRDQTPGDKEAILGSDLAEEVTLLARRWVAPYFMQVLVSGNYLKGITEENKYSSIIRPGAFYNFPWSTSANGVVYIPYLKPVNSTVSGFGQRSFQIEPDTNYISEQANPVKKIVTNWETQEPYPFETVTWIDDYAFTGNDLSEIGPDSDGTLHLKGGNDQNMERLGRFAFQGTKIKHLIFDVSSTERSSTYQNLFQTSTLQSVEWNSVLPISNYCFYGNTDLTSVNLQQTTQIDSNAFYQCSSLTELTIPETVTQIGTYALQIGSATNKATITLLGETPPTIASDTFRVSWLEAIKVPASAVDTYKAATNWSAFADLIVAIE